MVGQRVRTASIAVLAIAIVLCVPAVPTLVASLRGWSLVSDGAATAGHVTVTGCHSTLFGITATCRGTFGYADPGGAAGAQPATDTPDVTIANDPRHHRIGDVVDVSLAVGTHRAYVSSARQEARVITQVLGLLSILVLLVFAALPARRPPQRTAAAAGFGLACVVLVATWLLLPTPPHPPSGPIPPTAAINTK